MVALIALAAPLYQPVESVRAQLFSGIPDCATGRVAIFPRRSKGIDYDIM